MASACIHTLVMAHAGQSCECSKACRLAAAYHAPWLLLRSTFMQAEHVAIPLHDDQLVSHLECNTGGDQTQ